jgi:hypothetical protein
VEHWERSRERVQQTQVPPCFFPFQCPSSRALVHLQHTFSRESRYPGYKDIAIEFHLTRKHLKAGLSGVRGLGKDTTHLLLASVCLGDLWPALRQTQSMRAIHPGPRSWSNDVVRAQGMKTHGAEQVWPAHCCERVLHFNSKFKVLVQSLPVEHG